MRAIRRKAGYPLSAVAVAAFAVVAQRCIFNRSVVFMDEGQVANIASRLVSGEVLYRDIYTGVFPGAYYLAAALFAAFGEDLLVLRWGQVAVNAVTALLLFLIAARAVRLRWALLASVLYVVHLFVDFPGLSMWNYSSLSMALALGAFYFLSSYLTTERFFFLGCAGLAVGLAFACKQNFGVLASLALAGAILSVGLRGSKKRITALACLLPFAVAEIAVLLAVLLYLASNSALSAFVDATFLSLFNTQLQAFNNPIPGLFAPLPLNDGRFTFLYLPPSLFNYLIRGETLLGQGIGPLTRVLAIKLSYGVPLLLLVAAPCIAYAVRKRATENQNCVAAAICVFAPIMFLGIFPSAIWSHLAFIMAPVFLLAAVVVDRIDRVMEWYLVPFAIWRASVTVAVAVTLLVGAAIGRDVRRWYAEPLGLERASLMVSPRERSLLRGAAEFVRQRTAPGDPIFVAPDMPVVYFVTNRRNPTPYDLVIPGNISEDVILDRLREARPACAVYNPKMYLEFPAFEILFPRVEEYLRREYQVDETISGDGTIWEGLSARRRAEPTT
jgi:hypothetical protein